MTDMERVVAALRDEIAYVADTREIDGHDAGEAAFRLEVTIDDAVPALRADIEQVDRRQRSNRVGQSRWQRNLAVVC